MEIKGIRRRSREVGFTLIEVMLAVAIAVGMISVALYFYQQAGNVRKAALEEIEKITSVRLVMDRLSTELRCALNGTELLPGISGTSTSIEFVRLDTPIRGSRVIETTNSTSTVSSQTIRATYRKTRYGLIQDKQTGLSALERIEEPIRFGGTEMSSTNGAPSEAMGSSTNLTDFSDILNMSLEGTNGTGATDLTSSLLGEDGTNRSAVVYAGETLWGTNSSLRESGGYVAMEGYVDEGTNSQKRVSASAVFARGIGYFNLRYYDGSQWVNSWNKKELPLGIEIIMAAEDPEDEASKSAREMDEESESFETSFTESDLFASEEADTNSSPNLSSSPDDDAVSLSTEIEDSLISGFDTNVVVFQRIVFLPNARRTVPAASVYLSSDPYSDSGGSMGGGEGGLE